MITLIRIYQKFISPLLGKRCRFYPTCSQYFIEAIKKYGYFTGSVKGIKRIGKCHPFNAGGIDEP